MSEITQSTIIPIFQNLIDILAIKERVLKLQNTDGVNFYLENKQKYYAIVFSNQQRYIFIDPQQELSNDDQVQAQGYLIIKDQIKYSIVLILNYYYNLILVQKQQDQPPLSKSAFINLANSFQKALGSTRVYSSANQIIWSRWTTYWNKPQYNSVCLSSCSGSCNEKCQGAKCLYFFPSNELNNPNLPEKEKTDDGNVFNDQLFQVANLFLDFLDREQFQQETFFFFNSRDLLGSAMMNYQPYGIKIQLKNGDVVQFNSFAGLYNFEQRQQITSLSILDLENDQVCVGEEGRNQLYEYILGLQNLSSLQIQLEKSIYHTNEENYQPPQFAMMYSIPVPDRVVNNFVSFLLKLKVNSLSVQLDECCYPISINHNTFFIALPNLNKSITNLHLSINYRRMHNGKIILEQLCKMKQLKSIILDISKQWSYGHSTFEINPTAFDSWQSILKQSIPSLSKVLIR